MKKDFNYYYPLLKKCDVIEYFLECRNMTETCRNFNIGRKILRKLLISENLLDTTLEGRIPNNGVFVNIGERFSRWTVISAPFIYGRRYSVLCKCDCGTETVIRMSNLLNGRNTGCRHCSNKVISYPSSRKTSCKLKHYNGLYESWLCSIKRNSMRGYLNIKVLDVDITLSDLYDKLEAQNFKCALTGEQLNVLDITRFKSNASVDRIDNNLGYTKENIQWVLKDVNLMKNKFNQKYFIEICDKISKFNYDNPEPSSSLNG